MRTTNFSLLYFFSFFFFCLFAHFALFWSPDGKKASSHTNFTGLGSTADRCSADLFHRRTKSQLIVGLPRFYVHSKVDFRGKSKVLRVIIKPKWNVLPPKKNISRDKGRELSRLRSETHWQMFFYLNLHYYFEATGPHCFNVLSVKYFCRRNISLRSETGSMPSAVARKNKMIRDVTLDDVRTSRDIHVHKEI